MGLLDKLKQLLGDGPQGDGIDITAPVSGELVDIEAVPDVVFADKIVGDGIAIKPSSHQVVAPVNGTIGKIFETNHAFSIESEDGVEIFVHIGIDTVELKGEGFVRVAQEGQQVKRGEPVLECDLAFLQEHARSILTPVVVSNMDDFRHIRKKAGKVKGGEDIILTLYR
ncbi:PTS glucose transporter subunit IIA [Gallaecimonas pentaromativorans]|uniref:PTS system glucose-specific EIIA component n=1 Tax=Gallaecimonas pentaromativorans TaxID=584787 RepID=A0A3N1PPK6_9GAMM|nr:PTS glucose transporter subunit IIA [Gallaecimonas pentaromativorans]MED5524157.1 PTS glucose transporter subunit IIA [Pseudomonadota bacterium]ROQ29918.1 PTS system D-glucose-specific IIA component (Glc family) [Gallaecimonas pentaromativorans]